ncbi:MAG: radical SAM protein [Candidatus Margulisiibacteriota bacterium]
MGYKPGILARVNASPRDFIGNSSRSGKDYSQMPFNAQALYRRTICQVLIHDFWGKPKEAVTVVDNIFSCKNRHAAWVLSALVRELLIQPMASSWALMKNMEAKYGISLRVSELTEYYQLLQNNQIVQDMIRFNSTATKVIALARGVLSTTLGTTYYLDVQTTDACRNKCTKCWRFYEDEQGRPRLLTRTSTPGTKRPGQADFREVIREAIELGVEQLSSTGGGEPLMNPNLPELFEFAKQHARSLGRDIRTFIPCSGLGVVFKDPVNLERLVRSLNNLRFSVDSFDPDFVCRHHGISRAEYDEIIQNIRATAEVRRRVNPDMQIEVLILMYEDSYASMERTIETARELGATRILVNSTVDKPELRQTSPEQAEALRRVSEKAAKGEYGDLVVEIDPVLEMSFVATALPIDTQAIEPPLGMFGACMKNIVGLTPVVTADGTFHVCFPCSQPPVANKGKVFIIGNIMEDPFLVLMERMKKEYRDIDVERDCSPDCRDIMYFNAIIRKVIEDWLLGIPLCVQPFLDRNVAVGTTRNPMHQEGFRVQTEAEERIARAAESVYKDKERDFGNISRHLSEMPVATLASQLNPGVPVALLDKYETPNLFDVNLISDGRNIYAFSYDIGRIYSLQTCQSYRFGETLEGLAAPLDGFFLQLWRMKGEGRVYLPQKIEPLSKLPDSLGDWKIALKRRMLLSKYYEWQPKLVEDAYNYFVRAKSGEVVPENPLDASNGIVLMTLFEREAGKSEARKQALLKKLHAYMLQLATTREFCRDFISIYKILVDNQFI